jgi:hypothetical protein
MPDHSSPPVKAPAQASGTHESVEPAVLDLRVAELRQLFNAMDPAPFHERDLDARAVTYILEWGREIPAARPLSLVVHLGQESATTASASLLSEAIHAYFSRRALATRRQLRQLLRVGRISLLIGLVFLASAIVLGEFVAELFSRDAYSSFIRESFVIGGWVALWRPLEIFLYEWWPIRNEARLQERLSTMNVEVLNNPGTQQTPAEPVHP